MPFQLNKCPLLGTPEHYPNFYKIIWQQIPKGIWDRSWVKMVSGLFVTNTTRYFEITNFAI
jgi:hypothetical protein